MRRRISLKAKRTPEKWCHHFRTVVLDPDGWRAGKGIPWDRRLTQDEFLWLWGASTATQGPKVYRAMQESYRRMRAHRVAIERKQRARV